LAPSSPEGLRVAHGGGFADEAAPDEVHFVKY
jgi:hypothetical protein